MVWDRYNMMPVNIPLKLNIYQTQKHMQVFVNHSHHKWSQTCYDASLETKIKGNYI